MQFALDPKSFQYYLIEVNPRVSRSSALASKASGYPIARVSAKICVGMHLDEIALANTPASFEPALDYVVTKMPRFPFDKFSDANNRLGTQMKATGETMSVGRTFEESLLKGIRSLEIGVYHLHMEKFDDWSEEELLSYIAIGTDDRIYAIAQLLRLGISVEEIARTSQIDAFFVRKMRNIVEMEDQVSKHPMDSSILFAAKKMGFSDRAVARLWHTTQSRVYALRKDRNICPGYRMIDSCAVEFDSYIPYFYSTYETENESYQRLKKKDLITDPKNESSKRTIVIPDMLVAELKEYVDSLYGVNEQSRLFTFSRTSLHRVLEDGCRISGVKKIAIHDIRHSHISMLANSGIPSVIIAPRVGHALQGMTGHYSHPYASADIATADMLNRNMESQTNVREKI